jgi:hypothetical protein
MLEGKIPQTYILPHFRQFLRWQRNATRGRLKSVESSPISVEVQFRSGVEQLSLTPLGDRLYRLALSRLCASHPTMGDIIEADSLPDGRLRFRRIVKRAGFQRLEFLIHREVAESERLARFLDKVISLGGNWERNFGGWLVLFLPKSVSAHEITALLNLEVLGIQAKMNGTDG